MMYRIAYAVCIAVVVLGTPARAAVVDSAPGGFTVRHVVEVSGTATAAY